MKKEKLLCVEGMNTYIICRGHDQREPALACIPYAHFTSFNNGLSMNRSDNTPISRRMECLYAQCRNHLLRLVQRVELKRP